MKNTNLCNDTMFVHFTSNSNPLSCCRAHFKHNPIKYRRIELIFIVFVATCNNTQCSVCCSLSMAMRKYPLASIHYTNRRETVNFQFSHLFHASLILLIKNQWETFRLDLTQTLLCVRCDIFLFFIYKTDFLTILVWNDEISQLSHSLFINSWMVKYLQFVGRNHFNSIPFSELKFEYLKRILLHFATK